MNILNRNGAVVLATASFFIASPLSAQEDDGGNPALEEVVVQARLLSGAEALVSERIDDDVVSDVIGAELGGALKNVIAIACGAAIGAGYGDSARAALMTRGYAEICRIANVLGAKSGTLSGLSGFGDLSLTCMSEGSRNFSYGVSLGNGLGFDPSVTVEGVSTAKAILNHPSLQDKDMPITRLVHNLSSGQVPVKDAMQELMSRPQKEE